MQKTLSCIVYFSLPISCTFPGAFGEGASRGGSWHSTPHVPVFFSTSSMMKENGMKTRTHTQPHEMIYSYVLSFIYTFPCSLPYTTGRKERGVLKPWPNEIGSCRPQGIVPCERSHITIAADRLQWTRYPLRGVQIISIQSIYSW